MTIYTFGPFTVDTDAVELRRGEERIPLRPKCFDLLVYLIEQRGKVVSKEQLLDGIWRDVVVDDATVGRTVTATRAALDDDATQPRYIETVSRRGYKFIAPVQALGGTPGPAGFALIHGETEYPLHAGSQFIGRGRDVDIALYTPSTSRRHARIDVDRDAVVLIDLASRHGTFVNGKRISGSMQLAPGDQIEIGGERLVLWSPASETSAEPPSVDLPR
ncbi:MAG TPA: FHA domain-containing protein [Thermoanaerobaculia bacterium]|jgi:DNA-binding winged helix-turn-helix (wHTH) protein